jgi:hypothetical protein
MHNALQGREIRQYSQEPQSYQRDPEYQAGRQHKVAFRPRQQAYVSIDLKGIGFGLGVRDKHRPGC